MKKRSREILTQLINKKRCNQQISINELAELFHVSSRTIRNDIVDINDFLKDNKLGDLTIGKKGVLEVPEEILTYHEEENPEEAEGRMDQIASNFYNYRISREDRISLEVVILICSNDYITLQQLSDHLLVSRSTVIQDLDQLKAFFKDNKLYLFTQSNKGLLVEGEERQRRKILFSLIRKHSKLFREKVIYSHLISCLSDSKTLFIDDRLEIEKTINQAEHTFGRYMTDGAFFQVRTYLELCSFRIKAGFRITEAKEERNSKYEMAAYILRTLTQRMAPAGTSLEVPELEIRYFSLVLNNIRYLKKETSNRDIVRMQILTRTFIERVSKELKINLQNDYIFYENLVNHLESTFSTTVDNFNIADVVGDVLKKYPDIKQVAKNNIHIFEEYIHRPFTDSEDSYIAVHICAALERMNSQTTAYKVLLVCNGGIGTSQLLMARLVQFFNIQIVDIISEHNLRSRPMDDVDLIISTINLDRYKMDYIQVEALLTDMDCIRVGQKLSSITKENRQMFQDINTSKNTAEGTLREVRKTLESSAGQEEKLTTIEHIVQAFFQEKKEIGILDLLTEGAIECDLPCNSWQESIRLSARYLLKNDFISQNYVEKMVQNVMENGPYIVLAPGFALAHEALDSGAYKVGMSLIRLKTPVFFGKEEYDPVEWVCCLSAIDKEKHLKAMFRLVNLFHHPVYRKKLQDCRNEMEIYDVIKEFEDEERD